MRPDSELSEQAVAYCLIAPMSKDGPFIFLLKQRKIEGIGYHMDSHCTNHLEKASFSLPAATMSAVHSLVSDGRIFFALPR